MGLVSYSRILNLAMRDYYLQAKLRTGTPPWPSHAPWPYIPYGPDKGLDVWVCVFVAAALLYVLNLSF